MTTNKRTLADRKLLRFTGMLGHSHVGISGDDDTRHVVCETNSLESAKRVCDDIDDLSVYTRASRGRWLKCYDRNDAKAAALVKEINDEKPRDNQS
jgi:hypothetical protein